MGRLLLNTSLFHELVEFCPRHLGNVHGLQLLAQSVEELELWRFAGHFFKLGVLVESLEVFLKEFLHFGKLVQTSSGAGLNHSRFDSGVHVSVLSICNVLVGMSQANHAHQRGKSHGGLHTHAVFQWKPPVSSETPVADLELTQRLVAVMSDQHSDGAGVDHGGTGV